jgi:hypothetical protein
MGQFIEQFKVIFIILMVLLVFRPIFQYFINKEKKLKIKIAEERAKLKIKYDEALKSNNKEIALICGRLYYSSLRDDGLLTVYDEVALANDLATIEAKENK